MCSIAPLRESNGLIFEPLVVGPLEVNCYILAERPSGPAVVIDPGADSERILAVINRHHFYVEKIVLTHAHGDHIGAVSELKRKTGAKILIHPGDAEMLTSAEKNLSLWAGLTVTAPAADQFLNEGDEITIGAVTLKVLHTPGHSPGGISLVGPDFVFTGDLLFAGSVGRTDFPGADAPTLMRSIKEKILPLGDHFTIYPGHGDSSTIGEEKRTNFFLNQRYFV